MGDEIGMGVRWQVFGFGCDENGFLLSHRVT